jgi:hypothetical protein
MPNQKDCVSCLSASSVSAALGAAPIARSFKSTPRALEAALTAWRHYTR